MSKPKVHFAVGGLIDRKWKTGFYSNVSTYKKTDTNCSCCTWSHTRSTFEPELVTCKLCLKQMEKRGVRPEVYADIENLPPHVKLTRVLRDNIEKLAIGYKMIVIDGISCLVEEGKANNLQLKIGETLEVFEVEINVKPKIYGFKSIK